MSLKLIIAGYIVCLFAAMIACWSIARSRHAGHSPYWVMGALGSALAAGLFIASSHVAPAFVSIVLYNEAALLAMVLLHQGVVAAIESPERRYLSLSLVLLAAALIGLLYFTYVTPSLSDRIILRTVAISIQVAVTTLVLFRHRSPELDSPVRAAAWTLAALTLLQAARIAATLIWPPLPSRLHPGMVQDFFTSFSYLTWLACCAAVVWVALCAQRYRLQALAAMDDLSGLMNRRGFRERLERELRRSDHEGAPVSLLMMDLDRFKEINDAYGHPAGDDVIRRVGQLLSANTRAGDAVARYGGEEFAMLLCGIALEQAESIAERLRTQIEFMAGLPDSMHVTVSIGVAVHRAGETPDMLIERSDRALYYCKRAGRNRVSAHCVQIAWGEAAPVE